MPDKPQVGGSIWVAQTAKAQQACELIRAGIRKLLALLGDDSGNRFNKILTDILLAVTDLQSALGELERIGVTEAHKREKRRRTGGAPPDDPSPQI
jgi:hypothetical protein